MYIFIDIISPVSRIIAFENNKIKSNKKFEIKGREYDEFLEVLMDFLSKDNIEISTIKGFVIINGPGGFTGTRIISLIINTIQFVFKTPIEQFDYFSFMQKIGKSYPFLIKANKGEYLLKESISDNPILKKLEEIYYGNYFGIGYSKDFENNNIGIQGLEDIDFEEFITSFTFKGENKRVEPYYIKKPNIT